MSHKIQGRHYRKGITLNDMFQMFPDDATAEKWFMEVRWPDGVYCPVCGLTNVQIGAKHKTMFFRCREKECGKKFSVKTDTVMESSNLGYQIWAIATYLLTTNLNSVSSIKLHRDLGIAQSSAWYLAHRIRKSFEEESQKFSGIVEVDDTHIGGVEKNKFLDKNLNVSRER